MFTPSSQWFDNDRDRVVAAYGLLLHVHADMGKVLLPIKYGPWAQAMTFLVTKPAEFLEANRSQIIEPVSHILEAMVQDGSAEDAPDLRKVIEDRILATT